nr:hypothetical protein [Candidatus Freyarchaeota archaeon]
MVEAKAWTILGIIGGIFAILEGILIYIGGIQAQNTLITYFLIFSGPAIASFLGLTALAALLTQIQTWLLFYLQYISPSIATILPTLVGPLGTMMGWQGGGYVSIAGVAIAVLGVLILLGAIASMRSKAGAAILIIFGILGTFSLNFGGILALIGGLALWFE